jgi:hypothetical protein
MWTGDARDIRPEAADLRIAASRQLSGVHLTRTTRFCPDGPSLSLQTSQHTVPERAAYEDERLGYVVG